MRLRAKQALTRRLKISACLKTIFIGNNDDLKTAPKTLVHGFCLNQPAFGRAH